MTPSRHLSISLLLLVTIGCEVDDAALDDAALAEPGAPDDALPDELEAPETSEPASEEPAPLASKVPQAAEPYACASQCTNSEMIIGCDDREQGNLSQSGTTSPYDMIGQVEQVGGGGDCTGTLIADKFVLTAAHCFVNKFDAFVDIATGFSLSQSWEVEPYGKIYAERVFVPKAYAGGSITATNKAFDYAVLELSEAPGVGADTMDVEYLSWTTIEALQTTAVGYPYEKVEGTVWFGRGNFAADQPYRWFDAGESGTLRVSNDGTGGMSGGPLYVWDGGVRKLVGVFIGSPKSECESGYTWAARMTPEAVERIDNAMLYPPNGNVIDFSWDVYEFSSVPATEP